MDTPSAWASWPLSTVIFFTCFARRSGCNEVRWRATYDKRVMAGAAAGSMAGYLCNPAHVDTDRRQSLPRADSSDQPLLEYRLPGVLLRASHTGNTMRQWPHPQHHVRLRGSRAQCTMLRRTLAEHSSDGATGCRVLSGHDAHAPGVGCQRANLD